MPRAPRQFVFTAAAIGDELDRTPILAPIRLRQLLDRADFAHRDLGLVELCIEPRHVRERQDPELDDLVQRAEIQPPCRGARKPRIVHQIDAPHRAQPGRKRPTSDNTGGDGEMLTLRTREERAIGGAEHCRLRTDILIRQIDMGTLVDREQGRRHRHVDILALPGCLATMERREDGDDRLQSGIDVGMRQAIGARLLQGLTIVPNAVLGKTSFGLHRWCICHPAAPGPTLAVTGDRCVDQPRIALPQGLVVKAEEAKRPRTKVLHHDIGGIAELQRQIIRAGNVQIDTDIALAGILLRIIARHAVGGWKCKTRYVRAWRFDFDDLGTEILQCPRAQRTGEHAGEIDHTNSAERATHDQRPANLARPGPFLRNEARPAFRSSDAQIGACTLAIALSAAATPSLTAIWASSLVAAWASVGPCANSSAIAMVAFSSDSSGTVRLMRPHFSSVGAS